MTNTEARDFLEVLIGYWPSPALTDEEAKTWRTVLTKELAHTRLVDQRGRPVDTSITFTEARVWLSRNLQREWRPTPNLLEVWVRAERRASTAPAGLPEGTPMPEGFKRIITERLDPKEAVR